MTTTKKEWVNNHKPKEKVKIKPPTVKANKYPLTFDIRVQIDKLCKDLPQVPYFMIGADGKGQIQQIKRVQFTGQSSSGKGDGMLVNNLKLGKETRQMNHKVNLNSEYQLRGQAGIDGYVKYVVDLHNSLMAFSESLNNAAESKATPLEPNDMLPNMPIPEDFGFTPTGWAVEGGEQAYNKAMAEYEEHKANFSKPTEINN